MANDLSLGFRAGLAPTEPVDNINEGWIPEHEYIPTEDGWISESNVLSEEEKDAIILNAFQGSVKSSTLGIEDREAAILHMARETGLPADYLESNFDEAFRSWQASNFDPRKWREENPALASELLRKPMSGKLVFGEQKIGPITKRLRRNHAKRVIEAKEFDARLQNFYKNEELPWYERILGIFELVLTEPLPRAEVDGRRAPTDQEYAAAQEELAIQEGFAERPPVMYLQDERAMSARDSFLKQFFYTYQDAQAGIEYANLGMDLITARIAGNDTWEIEKKIADLEGRLVPRDYGASGLSLLGTDIAQALPSQVEVIKGGGVGAGVGYVGTGAAALAITRSPATAHKVGLRGASLLGQVGAATASFRMITGSSYLELRNLPGVDDEVAMGAAIVEGSLGTLVEMASFGPALRMFGPLGEAFGRGEGRAFIRKMLADTSTRQVFRRAFKSWAQQGATEFSEEFAQSILHDVVQHTVLDDWDEVDGFREIEMFDDALKSGASALAPSLGMGVVGLGTTIAQNRFLRDKSQISADRVQTLYEASELAVTKSDPEFMAEVVAAETKASGEEVTELYGDANAIQKVLLDEGVEAQELFGEDVALALNHALASGNQVAIPVARYFQGVSKNRDVVGKLNEHLVTRPGYVPPAQEKAEQAAIKAEADAILEDMKAELEEEQATKEGKPVEKKPRKSRPKSKAEQELADKVMERLIASGRYTPEDAMHAVALMRAMIRTQARVEAPNAKEAMAYEDKLFGHYSMQIDFENAPEQVPQHAVAQRVQRLTDEVQALRQQIRDAWDAHSRGDISLDEYKETFRKLAPKLESAEGSLHDAIIQQKSSRPIPEGRVVYDVRRVDELPESERLSVTEQHEQAAAHHLREMKFWQAQDNERRAQEHLDLYNAHIRAMGLDPEAPTPEQVLAREVLWDNDSLIEEQIKQARGKRRPALHPADKLLKPRGPLARLLLMQRTGWHGTKAPPFDAFSNDYATDGMFGFGHYFTTDREEAEAYRKARTFGLPGGTTIEVTLPPVEALLNFHATLHQQPEGVKKLLLDSGLATQEDMDLTGELFYRRMVAESNARTASENLAAVGIPGMHVDLSKVEEDGFDRNRHHAVIWDPTAIRIDNRYYAGTTHTYKGYMERVDNLFNIMLSPHADLSTFLHESGHVFLEMMQDLAHREGASQRIKDDYAATLKFMGATEEQLNENKLKLAEIHGKAAEEGRELNEAELEQVDALAEPWERFARGFEAYLREGNAPSAKLRRAFLRFRSWLMEIYPKASALGVELNDDIRGVFDRLLATDRELKNARRRMQLQPFWASPLDMERDLGRPVTPEEWKEYTDAQEEATAHPVMAANMAAMKDELREKTRWWKNEETLERVKAAKDYEQLPERKAWLFLLGMTLNEQGIPKKTTNPPKLSRKVVISLLGETRAERFRNVTTLDENLAMDVDAVAQDFGFNTGAEMLKAIENLPPKTKWVRQQAKDRMQARFPGLHNDINELKAVVEKGLHGEHTLKWLLLEIKALQERVRVQGPQQRKRPKGKVVKDRQWTFPRLNSIRDAAQRMAEDTKIGNLNAHRILQTERRLHYKALKAAARGDFEQVLVLKYKQVFNVYLHSAINNARKERARFEGLAKTLRKDSVRRRIAKGVLVDEAGNLIDRGPLILLDGIDTVLEALGLRKPIERERPAHTPREVVQAINASGGLPPQNIETIEKIIQSPRSYKDLTLAEMREVYSYLKNVRKASERRAMVLLSDGTYADIEEVEKGLIEDAERNRVHFGPDPGEDTTLRSRINSLANGVHGSFLKIETIIDFLSGGDHNSFWWRAVLQPIQNAKHRKSDLARNAFLPLIEKLENIPSGLRSRMNEKIDGHALFPDHTDRVKPPSTIKHLVMLVLNSGTASSSSRLLTGRKITFEQVKAAAAKHLDKELMDFIQSVWDASAPLWPLERDLQERLTGVAPKKLEPQSFETPWGTYRGGYFHLTYRWKVPTEDQSKVIRSPEDVLDGSYLRPTAPHSHLKERVQDFDGIVELDNMATIYRSIMQSVHDIAYREALLSAANVILRPKVQKVLKERIGPEMTPQLLQWLRDIGLEHSAKGTVHAGIMNRAVRYMKGSLAVGYLGYKPSVFTGDVGNLLKSVLTTPLTKEFWWAGIEEYILAPFDTRAMAVNKSGEIRSLHDNLIMEYQNKIDRLQSRNPLRRFGPLAAFVDNAFTAAMWVGKILATPIWTGAYRQKLQELGTQPDADRRAVEFADSVIRQVFVSHNIVDQAGLLRDPGYMGASTMFFSYLSTAYNQQARILDPVAQQARETGLFSLPVLRRMAKVSGKLFAFYFVHNVLEEFLMGRGPEAADGEDDAERWANWFARKMLLAGFTTMPWANEAAGAIEWLMLGGQVSVRASPVASLMQDLGRAGQKALNGDWEDEREFMAIYKAGGVLFGYPTFPVNGSIQYLIDLQQGETDAEDWFDILHGITYNTPAQSPFRPLTPREE